MGSIEKSIEVDVPVTTVYNQWTQFEEFPRFMEGVQEVRQLDDSRLYWKADVVAGTRNGTPASSSRSPTSESRGRVSRALRTADR